MTDEPLFKNVNQALWVAYALEVIRASPKTPLRVLMEKVNDGQYCDPVQLSGVNFSGLDDLERHGQGVFVRNIVEESLEIGELCYVRAKYAMTEQNKSIGVAYCAESLAQILPPRDRKYYDKVALALFDAPAKRPTSYSISRKFGVPTTTVQRDINKAKLHFYDISNKVRLKLEPKFRRDGII